MRTSTVLPLVISRHFHVVFRHHAFLGHLLIAFLRHGCFSVLHEVIFVRLDKRPGRRDRARNVPKTPGRSGYSKSLLNEGKRLAITHQKFSEPTPGPVIAIKMSSSIPL